MKLLRLKSDPMLLVGAMAAMVGVASACVGSDSSEIRRVAELERVDPRAMVEIVAEPGDLLKAGDVLALLHSNGRGSEEAAELVRGACTYGGSVHLRKDRVLDWIE